MAINHCLDNNTMTKSILEECIQILDKVRGHIEKILQEQGNNLQIRTSHPFEQHLFTDILTWTNLVSTACISLNTTPKEHIEEIEQELEITDPNGKAILQFLKDKMNIY